MSTFNWIAKTQDFLKLIPFLLLLMNISILCCHNFWLSVCNQTYSYYTIQALDSAAFVYLFAVLCAYTFDEKPMKFYMDEVAMDILSAIFLIVSAVLSIVDSMTKNNSLVQKQGNEYILLIVLHGLFTILSATFLFIDVAYLYKNEAKK